MTAHAPGQTYMIDGKWWRIAAIHNAKPWPWAWIVHGNTHARVSVHSIDAKAMDWFG
jgi:hypothetical protein